MNKYQEALDRIKNKTAIIDGEKMTIGAAYCDTLSILQELVNKETPMKPYKDDLSYSGYKCSNCHNNIYELRSHNIEKTPYCIWCGQKLDWSDE